MNNLPRNFLLTHHVATRGEMGKILTGEYLPSSTDCNKLDECKSEPLVLDDIDAGVEGAVEDDEAVGDGGEDEEAGVPVQSLCQLSPCT